MKDTSRTEYFVGVEVLTKTGWALAGDPKRFKTKEAALGYMKSEVGRDRTIGGLITPTPIDQLRFRVAHVDVVDEFSLNFTEVQP